MYTYRKLLDNGFLLEYNPKSCLYEYAIKKVVKEERIEESKTIVTWSGCCSLIFAGFICRCGIIIFVYHSKTI